MRARDTACSGKANRSLGWPARGGGPDVFTPSDRDQKISFLLFSFPFLSPKGSFQAQWGFFPVFILLTEFHVTQSGLKFPVSPRATEFFDLLCIFRVCMRAPPFLWMNPGCCGWLASPLPTELWTDSKHTDFEYTYLTRFNPLTVFVRCLTLGYEESLPISSLALWWCAQPSPEGPLLSCTVRGPRLKLCISCGDLFHNSCVLSLRGQLSRDHRAAEVTVCCLAVVSARPLLGWTKKWVYFLREFWAVHPLTLPIPGKMKLFTLLFVCILFCVVGETQPLVSFCFPPAASDFLHHVHSDPPASAPRAEITSVCHHVCHKVRLPP